MCTETYPHTQLQWLGLSSPPPIWIEKWGDPLVTMTVVAGEGGRVPVGHRELSAWQLGAMWGWCQRNMPVYGRTQDLDTSPWVLTEPLVPAVAASVTAAAPEDSCCGVLCSHSETIALETNNLLSGPLPSASHTSLSTQVDYLGVV